MIYFTSDLHFWHRNAIKYQNRPFVSVDDMNEKLIEYWNGTVRDNDEVYVLGDVTMLRPERAMDVLSRLRGRKYLVRGNHDYFLAKKTFDPVACGVEWVKDYYELRWKNRLFVLCHYPFLSWNRHLYGSYNLHGHMHNFAEYNVQNREKGLRQYDVGVDANGYRPVSVVSVINFFEGQGFG